jgi:hypothetical protein
MVHVQRAAQSAALHDALSLRKCLNLEWDIVVGDSLVCVVRL